MRSSEFFHFALRQDHVWLPGDRLAYSDRAYTLLGYALENVTGRSYQDVLKERITEPLALVNTGFEVPDYSTSIIPDGIQWFGADFGNFNA